MPGPPHTGIKMNLDGGYEAVVTAVAGVGWTRLESEENCTLDRDFS